MTIANHLNESISMEEYLNGEQISEIRHELINGQVYAMTGASRNHNLISGNFFRELGNRLIEKNSQCSAFMSDMKVKVNQNFFYPDVMIVCDDASNSDYYVESPVIIIEVLSSSTRKNDTSLKRLSYFNLLSLKEYVLVEQDFCQVQFFRKDKHWQADYYFPGDDVFLNLSVSVYQ